MNKVISIFGVELSFLEISGIAIFFILVVVIKLTFFKKTKINNGIEIKQSNIKAGGDVVAGDKTTTYNIEHFALSVIFIKEEIFHEFLPKDTAEAIEKVLSSPLESIVDVYMHLQKISSSDTGLLKICGYLVIAAASIRELDFREAFSKISEAVTLVNEHRSFEKNKLYKEYFLVGFAYYANTNNADGLRSLINLLDDANDSELQKIALDALQEQDSKELTLERMQETVAMVFSLYERLPEDNRLNVANSLGLAYRRIGERGQFQVLEQAIEIFNREIEIHNDAEPSKQPALADLLNNKAITLIRMFELHQNEAYLNDAEKCLKEALDKIDKNGSSLGPYEAGIRPNICNNTGNLWKQRYKRTGNFLHYKNAIFFYRMAEDGWLKSVFPYHWSIVKKNKAEINLACYQKTHEVEQLKTAIQDSIISIQIRDYRNSPHQWLKTVKILFSAIAQNDLVFKSVSDELKAAAREIYAEFEIHQKHAAEFGEDITVDNFSKTKGFVLSS